MVAPACRAARKAMQKDERGRTRLVASVLWSGCPSRRMCFPLPRWGRGPGGEVRGLTQIGVEGHAVDGDALVGHIMPALLANLEYRRQRRHADLPSRDLLA